MKRLVFLLLQLAWFILYFGSNIYSQSFWEETNGPEGGLVQCIAVNKHNTIFAGFNAGRFGGNHHGRALYKSVDFGNTWQVIDINTNKDVQSITIDTSGTIFIYVWGRGVLKSTNNGSSWLYTSGVGTDNGILVSFKNNYIALGDYSGLYISTDSGNSWIQNSLTGNINCLFVDDSENIFASINSGFLYRSTDYGNNWSSVASGLTDLVNTMMQTDDLTLYAGSSDGISMSHDFGLNWIRLNNSPLSVISLSYGKQGCLYAGSKSDGIFISEDRGKTWYQRNNGLNCYYITNIISILPDQIIIGTYGDGFYSSFDNGENWQTRNTGVKSTSITSFIKFKDYLFAGSEQGIVYKTFDRGDSWQKILSLNARIPINCFTKTVRNSLLLANNFNIYKSVDDGKSWFIVANGRVKKFSNILGSSMNIEYIFTASVSDGVLRSTDDGMTWHSVNKGIGSDYISDIASNRSGIVFAASHNYIYRTSNYGVNWEIIYECPGSVYHTYLAVSSNNYLYAGFDWGSVKLSTDNGNTWLDKGQNLPLNRINSITTDSLNRVYVGNWWGQIFQSVDNGENWTDISSGMIGGYILNLFCDNHGNIYVGPYGGSVYRGVNSTFAPIRVNLYSPPPTAINQPLSFNSIWYSSPSASTYRLQVASNDGFDSASTVIDLNVKDTTAYIEGLNENTRYFWRVLASNKYGNSIWSIPWSFKTLLTSGRNDSAIQVFTFRLNQNYPNPFNPSTKIKFTIPVTPGGVEGSLVTLKVYDVLGNEVSTLVNEEKSTGNYEVEFNGSGLPSGIYFYRLQVYPANGRAGNFTKTKKMILLK